MKSFFILLICFSFFYCTSSFCSNSSVYNKSKKAINVRINSSESMTVKPGGFAKLNNTETFFIEYNHFELIINVESKQGINFLYIIDIVDNRPVISKKVEIHVFKELMQNKSVKDRSIISYI